MLFYKTKTKQTLKVGSRLGKEKRIIDKMGLI